MNTKSNHHNTPRLRLLGSSRVTDALGLEELFRRRRKRGSIWALQEEEEERLYLRSFTDALGLEEFVPVMVLLLLAQLDQHRILALLDAALLLFG